MSGGTILFAHSVAKIGGAEKVTLDCVDALEGTEYRAVVGALEDGPFLKQAQAHGAGTKVLTLAQPQRTTLVRNFRAKLAGRRMIDDLKISLIHTGDIFVARTLLPIAEKTGTPVVCHMHFPPDDGALAWVFSRYARSVNLTFLYCSYELKAACEGRLSQYCPGAMHQVIHNGVDTDRFQKNPTSPRTRLPADRTNIGIVANLQKRKGHDEFLRAAVELRKAYTDLHFHIIGGDVFGEARESELKRLARDLAIDDAVTFHGQVSDVTPFLNELDIYVCASHEEAFPISILEAMAFALPIASTNVNGIPEALTHEQTAILFKPGDVASQTQAITRLLDSHDYRQKLGQNARKTVCNQFSEHAFSAQLLELYKGTLGGYTS